MQGKNIIDRNQLVVFLIADSRVGQNCQRFLSIKKDFFDNNKFRQKKIFPTKNFFFRSKKIFSIKEDFFDQRNVFHPKMIFPSKKDKKFCSTKKDFSGQKEFSDQKRFYTHKKVF